MMLIGSALPALASHEYDNSEEPREPQCGWYENWNNHEDWWEYWCYYRHWGWEYVFWTWA